MNINVSIDSIEIQKCGEKIHKGEYNINKCVFSFSKEYTKKLVSIAVFTTINGSYKRNILNNECDIPFEVLQEKGSVELGVYSYEIDEDGVLKLRYSPSSSKFYVETGSYRNAKESDTPSVSEFEKYVYIFNDNAIEKTKEFNLNVDNRKKEIDTVALDLKEDKKAIEKIQEKVELSEQNAKASEQNASTSEQKAQNSANKALESENNITAIQEDINASKVHIDEQKGKVDKSVDDVEKLVEEATIQANISKEQADISIEKAGQVSADKNAVESMMTEVSTMRTSVEQTKTDTEQIKADTQGVYDNTVAIKEETLEAKTEVENSLENERIESDKKYARAIETDEIVIDGAGRVELDENGYMKDVSIESNLPDITRDVREGHNKFYLPITNFTKSGLEVDVKSHSCLSIRGTPTSTYFAERIYEKDLKMYLENGKTYTLYVEPEFRSAKTKVAFQITFNNDNDILFSSGSTMWLTNGRAVKTFTPNYTGEINLARVVVEGMDIGENYDFDLKVELVEGSYTLDTVPAYEEYGASPSLEFPSEFQNVVKNVEMKLLKNNLSNFTTESTGAILGTSWVGLDFEIINNYTSKISGKPTANEYRVGGRYNSTKILIPVDYKKNYYIYNNLNLRMGVTLVQRDGTYRELSLDNKKLLNLNENDIGISSLRIAVSTDIEYKDTILRYIVCEAIEENELALSEGQFLGKFNGYKNYIEKNKLKGQLKLLTLDGTENWIFSTTKEKTQVFRINEFNIVVEAGYLSNYFIPDVPGDEEKVAIAIDGIYFAVNKEKASTLDEWKALLKRKYEEGNPVKVLYVTTEEFEEDLSTENKTVLNSLKVYKGINNIYSNCKIRFKANQNIKNHIEKRLEELKDTERNISDNKYAKILKDSVVDEKFAQIYAENNKINNLIIKDEDITQEIRSGKNLYNIKDIFAKSSNISIDEEDWINVQYNGNASDIFSNYFTKPIKNLTPNTKYYLVVEVKEKNGILNLVASSNQEPNNLSQFVGQVSMKDSFTDGTHILEITTREDLADGNIKYGLRSFFTVSSISDIASAKIRISLLKDQPNLDNFEYEKYVVSPSLEFPSEVKEFDIINLSNSQENLFNPSIYDGIEVDDEGYIVSTKYVNISTPTTFIGKPNTKYRVIFRDKNREIKKGSVINIKINDVWMQNNNGHCIFETDRNGECKLAFGSSSYPNIGKEQSLIQIIDYKLNVLDDYRPFKGYNKEIFLPEGQFKGAIGDYYNEIKRIDGKWCLKKYIKELILTGDEKIYLNTSIGISKNNLFMMELNLKLKKKVDNNPLPSISNYFKYEYIYAKDEEHFYLNPSGNLFLYVDKEKYPDVATLKVKLKELYDSGKPIKIYYVGLEPEIIELQKETQQVLDSIELMDGLNNISIDKGSMSFEYNKSLARAFEEEKENNANLQAQIDEIKALLSSTSTASLIAENLAKDNESEVI